MGSLFRSEEMTLAQLFLQSEAAYACVRELGELGKVQFRDLNPDVSAFQRKFVNEVRRCDEMERKLRFLTNELEKADIEARPAGNIEAPDPQELIDLETKFERLEAEVREMNTNKETLKRNLLDLIELQHILEKTQTFFQEAEQYSTMMVPRPGSPGPSGAEPTSGDDKKGLLDDAATSQTRFMFVAGVIAQERLASFERVLWRACRGNVFIRQAPIEEPLEDPTTGANVFKVVFVLFFQGDALRTRVRKICEGFRATLYQCPESAGERADMSAAVNNRIVDLRMVLQTTQDHSNTQLEDVAQEIDTWRQKVTKVKSIYHTMNMFNLDMAQHCLVAECWCPVEDLDEIRASLIHGSERSGSTVPSILNQMSTNDEPPTYFKTNKFTKGFQAIVEAYGVASYREVNPALYTIITFPFLFAVMFGDAGHGLIMALFALILILFEKRITAILAKGGGAMFGTIFHGRYIMLLMGLFSIYTGLIYNDIFSKSFNIFGSSWNASYTSFFDGLNKTAIGYQLTPAITCCPNLQTCVVNVITPTTLLTTFPTEAQIYQQPYPFGIDPIWQVAENKLLFLNSYKMKLSVILGVGQMLFGVLLGIFNHLHFKNYISIILEYIPQILFLMCLFGWLVFLMFVKFVTFYQNQTTAPSLLITLISMVLKFTSTPSLNATEPPGPDDTYSVFYYHDRTGQAAAANVQRIVQVLLVIIAVVCIPWMLFPKPIYLYVKHKNSLKKQTAYQRHVETGSESEDTENILHHTDADQPKSKQAEGGEVEQFELGETFVHQSIHTIEYCLGTISNTASYLRLWALSLAHAELSEVLWTMVLRFGFMFGANSAAAGVIILIVVFFFWAALTVGILLVMEGLSAFLHALRLHWVEFQTKFYIGQGEKFVPFSFEAILTGNED